MTRRRRWRAALVLGAAFGASSAARAGELWRVDPRFDALVPADARLETVAEGFTWLEGPVWDARRGGLFFSDVARNTVFLWRAGGGARPFLTPSGWAGPEPFAGREPGSNGLALDARGRLVLCEHGDRRVSRLEADGSRTLLADRYQGRRLNSPNDLLFRANGELWFTDPPFGLPRAFEDPARELTWSGVYRLRPDGELELLTRELSAPNGIALSPDERTLYVSNSDPRRPVWMSYPVREDGKLGPGRLFFDATPWTRRWPGFPDGFAVDAAGHLFAAGPGGVHVFAPDGTHLGSILTGVATSNAAFGGDGSELFVTAATAVHRIRLQTRGAGFVRPGARARKDPT